MPAKQMEGAMADAGKVLPMPVRAGHRIAVAMATG